jgi:hypothetical protein
MAIKLVETLANGIYRETFTNAPAEESEHARFEQLGPWRQVNVAASQTTTKATLCGVDADAPTRMIMTRAGTLKGLLVDLVGTITAGGTTAAMTITVLKNGTATALAATLGSTAGAGPSNQTDLVDDASDSTAVIAFAKGDKIEVQVASTGTLAPTTTDLSAYVLIRWAP